MTLGVGTLTVGRAWRDIRDRFRAAGLATPELDARLLAQRAFGLDALGLTLDEAELTAEAALLDLGQLAARRLAGEPVARILGEQEFYGLRFALSAGTLVPRPETELLVDLGLKVLKGTERPRVLDLGTGTGCIPISLLVHEAGATALAVDLSADALATATANAVRHGVQDRLRLLQGSWFRPIGDGERFGLIVSNPPYIDSAEITGLAREVRDHDPILALDGGADGLDAYRGIAEGAPARIARGGVLLLEIGHRQGEAVTALLQGAGFVKIRIHKDLAGLDRVVEAHHLSTNTP